MATQRKNPNNSSSDTSKSMNKKRQPLLDISNCNLIPTSTLRKIVSSSASSASSSKPPISVSKSDSNTTSKPYYYNSPTNNSASETSVTSSNFNSDRNPNPPIHVSTVLHGALLPTDSSIIPSWDDETVVYNRRQTTNKSNLEATGLTLTSNLHENKEDKRKALAEPFLSFSPTTTKDKGKGIVELFSRSFPETKEDKGKGVSVQSTAVSGNMKKKGIHEPFMSSSPQMVKAKAKEISHKQAPSWDEEVVVYDRRQTTKKSSIETTVQPFTSSLHENKKYKRKAIVESLPPRITKDKGKAIAEPLPPTIMKDKGKAIADPFSSFYPEIKEDKGKGAAVLSTPLSGNKKKKGIHEPFMSSSPQTVKAKAKEISFGQASSGAKTAEERIGVLSQRISSLKKTRGKKRAHTSAFSCPTLPKTRTNRTEFNGAGDIKLSGSRTDPNGKSQKNLMIGEYELKDDSRRHTELKAAPQDSLPRDFVNYWREHYKAVDEFELPEEEASYSDLD